VRARRTGSGLRARRVAASTTWTAAWASVRQAAWTATGLAPARVRTQQPTSSPPSRSRAVAPRWSTGQAPWATSGRVVTPTVGKPKNSPEVEREAGAAGMVASGRVDQQHLGGDRQGAYGLLEQRPLPEGEEGWQVRPAGGRADAHPSQQAAAVGYRCPGKPPSPAAPAPWTRSKQTKQAPIRNTVVGGCQRSGVNSPRACCSWMSLSAVVGQVVMPDSVRRSRICIRSPASRRIP
jgi:hypothetical protein